jgi:hypothetical protein
MKVSEINHPLIKVPQSIDFIIYLISQELKIRRLFDGLQKAGMDDCYFEPHLDRIILAEIGLDDGTDQTMELFCKIIEKRSRKIKPSRESIVKQSFKVYMELTAEKTKRKNQMQ